MINFLKIALLCLMVCFMASCSSEAIEEHPQTPPTDKVLTLTSSMTQGDFLSSCMAVKAKMGAASRANQLTQQEAQLVMQPFEQDGLQLRSQIVQQFELDPSLKNEAVYFRGLTNEECAALSFVFHSMQDAGFGSDMVTGTLNDVQNKTLTVSTERLLHCAAVAVGYDAIKRLGVEGVITAVTVREAIIAIGKRYLGYIGLALMVYDFIECIS